MASPFGIGIPFNTNPDTSFSDSFSNDLNSNTTNDNYFQSNPSWVLSFVTFKVAQPLSGNADPTATNNVIVVTSDCIAVKTHHSKSNYLHTMEAILLGGQINYLGAINPGDYVVVNMLNSDDAAATVADNAQNQLPINGSGDGFKGIYKVTSVRKKLFITENGIKRIMFQIQGTAFTEFSNSVYFNPYLTQSLASGTDLFYLTNISKSFQNRLGNKTDLQSIVSILLPIFLGTGPVLRNLNTDFTASISNVQPTGTSKKPIDTIQVSPNGYFAVNGALASLMGTPSALSFNQFYRFLMGVQTFNNGPWVTSPNIGDNEDRQVDKTGYQPDMGIDDSNFYQTNNRLTGTTIIKPEYWNVSTGWSIMQQYCNAPINEMYTTFRLSPEGIVMPFMIFRQIPFNTSSTIDGKITTSFLSLPRWLIDPKLVIVESIGRDDAARFNFVQVFGKPFGWTPEAQQRQISNQIGKGTDVKSNTADIKRSGLRPYVIENSLDFPQNDTSGLNFNSPFWTSLLADAVMGGQMKLNGTIRCFGIKDPISIGDNVQFDNIVYHIEGIEHSCEIDGNGIRSFYTTLALSHGIDASSDEDQTVYGQSIKSYIASENADYDYQKIDPTINNDSPDVLSDTNISGQTFPSPLDTTEQIAVNSRISGGGT